MPHDFQIAAPNLGQWEYKIGGNAKYMPSDGFKFNSYDFQIILNEATWYHAQCSHVSSFCVFWNQNLVII